MKKILIIEDESAIRSTLRELLELNGYKAFLAEDGMEGVQLAKEINPDLIICDIMMPRMSGEGVIEELKKDKILSMVPFIFLTAKADISDFRNGMESGADDYITKPFRAATILKAIETRIQKFETIKLQSTNYQEEPSTEKKENLTENDRLFVNTKNKSQFIRIGDILCIKAEGEYSTIFLTSDTNLLVRKLMKQWELLLPENIFLRIHRSTILNINQIEKIEKWYKRAYIVKLKNFEETFIISQRYTTKIKSKFLV
ncbi:MAG: response regulator [Ignavibacteriaceae bacterium]|jgi:DNA-binding LytR/AlgR family response regulator